MNSLSRGAKNLIVFIIIALVLLVFGIVSFSFWKRSKRPIADPNTYQAVFFDPSNPYFGHLHDAYTKHPYLTDIYYIKLEQNPADAALKPHFSLIKFGKNELHGPEDAMYFSWDRILFWENLRADSQVVNAIQREKEQSKNPPPVTEMLIPASPPATQGTSSPRK